VWLKLLEKDDFLHLLKQIPEYNKISDHVQHPESYTTNTHATETHCYDDAQRSKSPAPTSKQESASHQAHQPEQEGTPAPNTYTEQTEQTSETHTEHPEHNDLSDNPVYWSIKKLREILTQNKVDYSACVERDEYMELLKKLPSYSQVHTGHPDSHVFMGSVDSAKPPHYF